MGRYLSWGLGINPGRRAAKPPEHTMIYVHGTFCLAPKSPVTSCLLQNFIPFVESLPIDCTHFQYPSVFNVF